jgi:hypothetical protein
MKGAKVGVVQENQDAPLPYKLEFEHRPDYLYAKVTGKEDSVAISLSYWTKVAEERKAHKYKKVLVDEDLQQQVGLIDMYEVAAMLCSIGFVGATIAFVDRHMDHLEYNKFGETVAVNRGLKGRVFIDIQEAEKWLLSA